MKIVTYVLINVFYDSIIITGFGRRILWASFASFFLGLIERNWCLFAIFTIDIGCGGVIGWRYANTKLVFFLHFFIDHGSCLDFGSLQCWTS